MTEHVESLDPGLVALPLDILHPDHMAVADALRDTLPDRLVRLHAEQPYATTFRDLV